MLHAPELSFVASTEKWAGSRLCTLHVSAVRIEADEVGRIATFFALVTRVVFLCPVV